MHEIAIPLLTTSLLSLCLATLLVVASRTLRVEEDPRVEAVAYLLPGNNCGACGEPGCRQFAEALVAGRAKPAQCTVSSAAGHQAVADFLDIDVGATEKRVARLACAGGSNVARARSVYAGLASCAGAARVGGGGKGCAWGCLGLADCARACTFDAITMSRHGLPVVDEAKCTACGDCVAACPRDLFSVLPADRRVFVQCKSELSGDAALEHCDVACTACGRCAMDDPSLVRMNGALPLVDLAHAPKGRDAIRRCPTGAIVWIDAVRGPLFGAATPADRRLEPRAPAPT